VRRFEQSDARSRVAGFGDGTGSIGLAGLIEALRGLLAASPPEIG
jgi:hypothetical protein